jgi:hypothetical protein
MHPNAQETRMKLCKPQMGNLTTYFVISSNLKSNQEQPLLKIIKYHALSDWNLGLRK